MQAEALFYDETLISAELSARAREDPEVKADSVFAVLSAGYDSLYNPGKFLRIKVRMYSHFARKSLAADLWTLYLIDENGDMYEPDTVITDTIQEKKIERWERNRMYYRTQYSTDINLYFSLVTFYRQQLIPPDRKYLKLVLSYQQEIIGEGTWCFGAGSLN